MRCLCASYLDAKWISSSDKNILWWAISVVVESPLPLVLQRYLSLSVRLKLYKRKHSSFPLNNWSLYANRNMYIQDCVKAHSPRISSAYVIATTILCQHISITEMYCLIFNCQFNTCTSHWCDFFFSNLSMYIVCSLSFHGCYIQKKPQAVEHV